MRPEDLPLYRMLRLEALRAHPTAFGADYEEDRISNLIRMIGEPPAITLGGFAGSVLAGTAGSVLAGTAGSVLAGTAGSVLAGTAGRVLVGTAGLIVPDRLKQRHKGHVVGVYVAPEWRRTGLARAMLDGLIAHGRAVGLVVLTLSVTTGNDAARRLYLRAGFTVYGREPRSLRVEDAFFDEDLMALMLD